MSSGRGILIGLALLVVALSAAWGITRSQEAAKSRQDLAEAERVRRAAAPSARRKIVARSNPPEASRARRREREDTLEKADDRIRRDGFEITYAPAPRPHSHWRESAPLRDGTVLAVDHEANVLVISLGREDGVTSGHEFIVSRGTSYITMIKITDVQEKKSAGHAIKKLSKRSIERGDKVMDSH